MFGVGIYKNSNIFQVVNKLNPQYFLENSYPPYVKCYLYIDEKNSHTHRQRHKYCVYVSQTTRAHMYPHTYTHTFVRSNVHIKLFNSNVFALAQVYVLFGPKSPILQGQC